MKPRGKNNWSPIPLVQRQMYSKSGTDVNLSYYMYLWTLGRKLQKNDRPNRFVVKLKEMSLRDH